MTTRWLGTLALVAATHCGSSVSAPGAADTGVVDATADVGAAVDVGVADVPVTRDAPAVTDEGPCLVQCPQPPPGCRYVGPVECRPGGCGTLVCADAGAPDAGAVMCAGGGATAFPMFDKSCRTDGDCFAALHQTDCCGNVRALGLNVSQQMAFTQAETTCRGQYPGCGCPARPPTDEDDRTSVTGDFGARCASGACRSFAR